MRRSQDLSRPPRQCAPAGSVVGADAPTVAGLTGRAFVEPGAMILVQVEPISLMRVAWSPSTSSRVAVIFERLRRTFAPRGDAQIALPTRGRRFVLQPSLSRRQCRRRLEALRA